MTAYAQHPLSAAFPAMSATEFQDLKDSIGNVGVQNTITLFDGMVLDGWNRYLAAEELGMPCPTKELEDGTDPRDFVLAQNKARRHITSAQIALATTAVYAWAPTGRPAEEKGGTECRVSKTTAELAGIAGTSERTIRQAKAVQTSAVPAVQEAVKTGEIGLPKAAEIARMPQAEQAAAIHQPAKARHHGKPKKVPAKKWLDAEFKAADAGKTATAATERVQMLETELARHHEAVAELQANLRDATADNESMAKVFEADDRLQAAMAEIDRLKTENSALRTRIDGLMTEKNEAVRLLKVAQRRVEKLEKAVSA